MFANIMPLLNLPWGLSATAMQAWRYFRDSVAYVPGPPNMSSSPFLPRLVKKQQLGERGGRRPEKIKVHVRHTAARTGSPDADVKDDDKNTKKDWFQTWGASAMGGET